MIEALEYYGSDFDDTIGEEYIITSTKELEAYFDTIYLYDYTDCVYDVCTAIKNSYLEQYNDDYFAQNVLLMKPILQNYGGQIMYSVFDVFYYNNTKLNVYFSKGYTGGPLECVMTPLLAMVTVPKSLYHAESVNWIQDMDYTISNPEV